METQHRRRRRSGRRKARKKQIAFLIVLALAGGAFVWTRILIDRRNDETLVVAVTGSSDRDDAAGKPDTNDANDAKGAKGATATTVAAAVPAAAAKNVILFIGSGYGTVPMTATRIYAVGESGELAVDRLPQTALVRTTSHNAQTADAAAAMTAYMTGVKVDNEVLSQTADTHAYDDAGRPQSAHGETTCPTVANGKPVATLFELAKRSGRATGIVTTARVTQPTAAAGYAHLCQAGAENAIAAQLAPGGPGYNRQLGDGIDVILGGGWQAFLPKDDRRGSTRNDTRDLFAEMRAKGYTVIGRANELAAVAANPSSGAMRSAGTTGVAGPADATPIEHADRVLGLFARSQMAYDGERAGSAEPSLSEMTTRAIDLLQHRATGYLLIVEGGRIGDALDASLARRAVQEGRAFDDAIAAALEKVRGADPDLRDTLIVVTANHDHTLVMNGDSVLTGRTVEGRPGVLGVLRGVEQPTLATTDAGGRPYTTLAFAAGPKRVRGPRSQAPALSDLALVDADSRYEAAIETPGAIGGADVPLGAAGSNATRFHGTIDNVQVFGLLREAMGL